MTKFLYCMSFSIPKSTYKEHIIKEIRFEDIFLIRSYFRLAFKIPVKQRERYHKGREGQGN